MSHPGQQPYDTPQNPHDRAPHRAAGVTMALNKRPPSSRRMLDGDKYLAKLPNVPDTVGPPELRFPMDENDAWGDCVIAGGDHAEQTQANGYGIARVNWDDPTLLAYYRTQNPDFDPAGTADTNGPGSPADGGMNIADFLTYLVKIGALLAFAKISNDPKLIRAAIYVGATVVTGEQLTAQQLQTSQTWTHDDGEVEGGHCTVFVAYTPDRTTLVTWGATVDCDDSFIEHNVDEAYLVLPTFWNRNRVDGFPVQSLIDDWEDITERPFPEHVGPNPPPAPSPAGGITGVDAVALAELQHLADKHTGGDVGAYLTWRFDPASREASSTDASADYAPEHLA